MIPNPFLLERETGRPMFVSLDVRGKKSAVSSKNVRFDPIPGCIVRAGTDKNEPALVMRISP